MKKTDLYLKPGTYIKSSTTTGEVQGISLENFVVSVLNNPTCCPKPPGSPDGMLMTALPLNLTLQTVTDFVGNNSAIQLSTLRLGITADSSVTTQTSSVIQATTTNANLVIAPNGTGALVASIPDGTTTGGNARGIYAVDLQRSRVLATEVAQGNYAFIGSGHRNTIGTGSYSAIITGNENNISSGSYSFIGTGNENRIDINVNYSSILNGFFNNIENNSDYAVISGGAENVIGGNPDNDYTVISGGRSNRVNSQYSTVSGGQSNTASTNTHATVVGGQGNTSSGAHSVSGGQGNTASGQNSIALGSSNIVAAQYSGIFSGQLNLVGTVNDAKFSVVSGGQSNTIQRPYSVIGGGLSNQVRNVSGNGDYSVIGGGSDNITSQLYSTISGGQSNVASTGSHATVVGGQSNVSSGQYAVSGGFSNNASNLYSVAIGANNIASGSQSVSIGRNNNCSGSNSQAYGFGNTITSASAMAFGANHTVDGNFATALGNGATASGEYSISMGIGCKTQNTATVAMGLSSLAYLYSQISNSSGTFTGFSAQRGDAQQSLLTARRSAVLTTGGTTVLSLDGTGTTNLIVPEGNNRLWAVKVVATAFVSVAGGTLVLGDSYMGEFTLLFKRVGGTSSVVGVNAGNIIYDTNMATAAFTFAAGASQDLQITFKAPTTASATTFRCVAKVELVEVAY